MTSFTITLSPKAYDDNFVFHLVRRWTVVILIIFSLVITCKITFGNSFVCLTNDYAWTVPFMNYHCYTTGTYISLSSWNKVPGKDVPYRGVDKYSREEIKRFFPYYGWVNIVLLVHAFNFYLPRLIWKLYEKGRMTKLVSGIEEWSSDEDRRKASIDVLANYLVASHGKHFVYATIYIICEVLNHVVALCQTVWLVYFFGLVGLPEESTEIHLNTWEEFAMFYFPLNSKCDIRRFGVSGTVQLNSVICSLPLNNTHFYTFLFLYAWYIFLCVITGLNLVYRMCLWIPIVRLQVLRLKAPLTHISSLNSICNRSSYFDWFVLSRVQKNLRQDNFADLISRVEVVSQYSEKKDEFEVSHKSS